MTEGDKMSNYKFSLQSVLNWRDDEEEAAKMKVKRLKDELIAEDARLRQLINENIRLKENLVLTRELNQLRQQDLYKTLLDERIIKQKLQVDQAENKVKLAEQDLLRAYQDKKIMEKLNEKEKDRHDELVKTEEQKQIDEFSTISFGRDMY